MTNKLILEVAVPVPLRQTYDYLQPPDTTAAPVGGRVQVSFGNRQLTGLVLAHKHRSDTDSSKLKPVINILDQQAVLSPTLMQLMAWASEYYQHPAGEAFATALPAALRKGAAVPDLQQTVWLPGPAFNTHQVSPAARKQLAVVDHLKLQACLSKSQQKALQISDATLHALASKNVIRSEKQAPTINKYPTEKASTITLNQEQLFIIQQFAEQPEGFQPCLLEGVTGSGKTEVYLQLIAQVLSRGQQALLLVPEIGLTPQTIERFKQRFDCPMAIFHSSLSDGQRLQYWQQARSGVARIIIGTRSALFTATENLGIIIVDEEHDLSYKQQDGLRYSARDAACMRAKLENIPVVLASATPTLESLHNAVSGKYRHWQLKQRAGDASPPKVKILDIRKQVIENGLAESVLPYLQQCLERDEQALLFINRRGFAPSLICHDCGWISHCQACDAKLTVHHKANHLRCHHCGATEPLPAKCPACLSTQLIRTGAGTERIEQGLKQLFPGVPVFRIDRDTTSGKDALPKMLDTIHQQRAALLIGTQMLAKGHHFPNVTLVIILEADHSLSSTDYRATERFGQLITQVTGRAGRAEKPGLALIQSHYPDHPQLLKLVNHGYHRFAMDLLAERSMLRLPPFSFQALIRLEDRDPQQAMHNLLQLAGAIRQYPCQIIGPFPANLQRRAWYYRYQLLLQANSRGELRHCVEALVKAAGNIIKPHQQRWSVDIDPQDMS